MYSVTKQFSFDAAHRVLGHGGKCKYLHGHSYLAEITIATHHLNDLGMVIDFADLKNTVGRWINENWDHNALFHPSDPLVPHLMSHDERTPYLMAYGGNPTAEGMAKELHHVATTLLTSDYPTARISSVRIYETATCWADYFSPLL